MYGETNLNIQKESFDEKPKKDVEVNQYIIGEKEETAKCYVAGLSTANFRVKL